MVRILWDRECLADSGSLVFYGVERIFASVAGSMLPPVTMQTVRPRIPCGVAMAAAGARAGLARGGRLVRAERSLRRAPAGGYTARGGWYRHGNRIQCAPRGYDASYASG